ncbi:MAG TPA: ABC transporter permease [Thermoplasmata archaeon]
MALAYYLAKRALFLGITLVIATYLVVIIANQGGLLDRIIIAEIRIGVITQFRADPAFNRLPEEEQQAVFEQRINEIIAFRGLDQPFVAKSFRQTWEALTLNLGRAQNTYGTGSFQLTTIIMERLPRTVFLFTTATVLSAVIGVWLGLRMARRALSVFDRGMTVLSITTLVIPNWVFGIFFILIFAFAIPIFPSGGMVSVPAPTDQWALLGDRLYHLALPLITVTFSSFGGWSYTTRNLVLQIMGEDFVTAARSKGLPEKKVLHRYVLRAASPPIITGIVLALIGSWTGAIITELVFNWPGLGLLFFDAVILQDAPTIIALTIIFAYLFVVTVFILDVVYGLMDPRIRALGR